MKQNLIFDITHYSRKSWFWRVTREIINRFVEQYKNDFNIYLIWNNIWIDEINWIKVYNFKWNYMLFKFYQLNRFLRSKKQWVFFSFDDVFFWKVKGYRYVTIIHDLWYEYARKINKINYIKKMNIKIWFFYWFDFTLKNIKYSDKIIVPSEYTKKDLIDFYNLKSDSISKIKVVNWWVDHFWKIKRNYKKWNVKILFPFPLLNDFWIKQISSIINNINIDNISEIILLWIRWEVKSKILKFINNSNKIKFEENYITEEDLIDYYNQKNICIYITHNDWFGFWPLECQYFWNPVLASYSTSIPYILWDSVEYIKEDNDINNVIKKINLLIENYEEYSRKSLENTKKYKWNNTVKNIYNLIKNI